jgi:hypothetical protein
MSAKPLTPEEERDGRIPVRALERSKIERLIQSLRETGSGRAHARTIVGLNAADALDAAFRLERLLSWYDYHVTTLDAARARCAEERRIADGALVTITEMRDQLAALTAERDAATRRANLAEGLAADYKAERDRYMETRVEERERCEKRLRDVRMRGMHNGDVRLGLQIAEQAIRDMQEQP